VIQNYEVSGRKKQQRLGRLMLTISTTNTRTLHRNNFGVMQHMDMHSGFALRVAGL
jgi:hypothetical protein